MNSVGVGDNALKAAAASNGNTAVGHNAGTAVTSGSFNALFGINAGKVLVGGSNNTLLGAFVASTTLTSGARNVLIGTASNCDTDASGTSDQFKLCASSGATPLVTGNLAAGSLAFTVNGTFGMPQATWTDVQTCTPGQVSVDANFIYVCTAANTVKRAALSAF